MQNVSQLYRHIIDELIEKVRQEYLDEGYDASVLQTLKTQWENKVNQANVYPTPNVSLGPMTAQEYSSMFQKRQMEKSMPKRELPPLNKVPIEPQPRVPIPRPQQPQAIPPQRTMIHPQGLQQMAATMTPAMLNAINDRQSFTQAAHLASQSLPHEFRLYPQPNMPTANMNVGAMVGDGAPGTLPPSKKPYILPKNNQLDGLPGDSGDERDGSDSDESNDLIPASVPSYSMENTPGPAAAPMTSYSMTSASPNPSSVSSKMLLPEKTEPGVEPPRKRSRKGADALGNFPKSEAGTESEKLDSVMSDDDDDDDLEVEDEDDELRMMLTDGGFKKHSGIDRPHDDSDLDNSDDSDLDEDGKKTKSDEEPLNSGDDVTDEETEELFSTPNVVVCQYEKVTRMRNKWRFLLKDGILHVNGKDYVFQKAQGEAQW